MITSDKQHDAAKRRLARLAEALAAPTKVDVPRVIADAASAQTQDLMAEIRRDIDGYEALKNSRPEEIEIHSLDDREGYQNITSSTLQKILQELNIHLEGKVA